VEDLFEQKAERPGGEWKVEVQDKDGNVMDTVNFTVE
jgi:subtilisin-like proprotein convertase family protein